MKRIPLFGVITSPEAETVATQVLRSGKIASGEFVSQFEAGISAITGLPNLVSTFDMTSAVFLALHLAGVGPGDEVLTSPFACMATNSAIAQCGATPVWVDVLPNSTCFDVADAASKITGRTKAIILYHVAGYPGPAFEVSQLCAANGISFIEDCDNALFATSGGVHVGHFADFSVFSFYPNRQINCTEGGALACKRPEDAVRARRLRRFGINPSTFRTPDGEINPDSDISEIGWAFTMNNLCAAIGTTQLSTAGAAVSQARANVSALLDRIDSTNGVRPILPISGENPAYWVMLLFAEKRDQVLSGLKECGVMASTLHQRNDRYSGFKRTPTSAELPNTDYLQSHILAVPCGWWVSACDVEQIGSAINNAGSRRQGC